LEGEEEWDAGLSASHFLSQLLALSLPKKG
jgi:hypothetical protein